MKKLFSLVAIIFSLSAAGQLTPGYKVPVPNAVILNHACMEGNMQQLFQSVAGTSDPASAQFTDVTSDALGNLYFTGFANFTVNPPTNPNFPYASPPITFGSNTANPITQTRPAEHKFFVAKYNANGSVGWVKFLSGNPVKIIWDESEQRLYVIFQAPSNGISINDVFYPIDSTAVDKATVVFAPDGNFYGIFKNNYTYDILKAGNKKILVYRRQHTTTYFETRFGFFENNQVVKWQDPPAGTFDFIHDLHYNPYDNSLWFLNNSKDKYYRLFLSTADTLIFENVARNLNKEIGFPIQNIKTIDKFHFLPGGEYIGEYYTQQDMPGYSPRKGLKLVRVDASGNVVWRTEFSPQNNMWHKALVDGNGDVWVDLPTTFYYDKCNAVTAGKEYTVNPWGNVGVVNNYLLQLDGATGDIKNAYINGYGNINYSMEISYYTNMQLLHLTASNKLITTPQIGGIAYYPDASGNFIPYYTTCTNQLLPSQFMWASFDLNNLVSFKREELDEELLQQIFSKETKPFLSVYPNPSSNEFTIQTNQSETFELYDFTGKMIDKFFVNENEAFKYHHTLPKGIYVLKDKDCSVIRRIIVQ